MKYHLMFDLETIGTRSDSIPHQIGAVIFNDEFEAVETFLIEPSIAGAAALGLTADAETIGWWNSRDNGGVIQENPVPFKMALTLFRAFLDQFRLSDPIQTFWAWGSDFDRPILTNAFLAAGLEAPWPYYLTRDARTVHALAFPDYRPAKGEIQHDALQDCHEQVHRLAAAFTVLNLQLGE